MKRTRSSIDLNEMVVFERVVSLGGFTAAARHFGVPTSTVSRKVAALERRLRTRLLDRTTRAVRPTELGVQYHAHCARIATDAAEADAALLAADETPRGTLRVTAPRLFVEYALGPILVSYARRFPEVAIELHATDSVVELVADGFDVALRIGASLADSTLLARALGALPVIACASPEYLKTHGAPGQVKDLDDHVTIGAVSRRRCVWAFQQGKRTLTVSLTPRIAVESLVVVREMCCAGLGIAVLPTFLVEKDLSRGALVEILPRTKCQPPQLFVVKPPGGRDPAKVRLFIHQLEVAMRNASWATAIASPQ